MIRQKILQQLLEWIECNLGNPISIEDIAQKSGYSRRNIQLLFRNFMHVPLGEYIRKRRLCRAAILVRLTAKSMLDIALSLHFDSQQSFSREFKKLFGCSPREYRLRDYWDLENIFPPFLTRQYPKTDCTLIHFPETRIFGNAFKYDIEVSNKSPDEEVKLRRHYLARYMRNFKTDIYFVSTFKPSTKSVDLLTVETFVGTVCEHADTDMPKEWSTTQGLYASFRYEGDWEYYPDWVRNVYLIELPARGLARVNGSDIERFYYNDNFVEQDSNDVVCEIFIPVRPV
ncbi:MULTISPECIES: helix-turn-helix domain-containing protein [Escherichia]|uniref:Helix-turn-helix domain-containing protein n=1 Tax=Escherichia whittamii TaxID=2762229 RepID=A0ABR8TH60_9ESCH|nr:MULTISPECIES: helix-turn-helix domain-containing protein [Escherichia]EEZ4383092.1 helix-turn-helix domain-containing protein [Escherichia coli]MBD7975115.1 helix-turn-helix domain-containing protein [Escherichia whittamii]MCA4890917.1 helix-turn-helix domain-containing protein [Escherichia whittamii]MEB7937699.1 helix-turn-helix domain-containing protein [Escherichia whittamii]MEC9497061.1 helix-turn-helix domain-containing protein [Escherichia whittamii]